MKYICTLNHTVEIESDTIIFFESPNFPRTMTDDERKKCAINFTKTLSAEEEDKRFVFVTSNIICDYDDPSKCSKKYSYSTNVSSYQFIDDKNSEDSLKLKAFQGFAYFDDWSDDCPLESISRINPFQFTDVNQIIVLQSTYDRRKPRNQSCLWQFKAPENYGFKLVITSLNITNNTIFKVENSRVPIITSSIAQITYPYYSTDNYLKIYLSKNDISYLPTDESGDKIFEFVAYVTIIKNFFNNVPINCAVSISENITRWFYFDEDNGYPSNAQCTYIMKILPYTEIVATLSNFELERNVDTVNYYDGSLPNIYGKFMKYPNGFDRLVFSAGDGNTTKEVLWKFISDGSVQSQGFEMQFETKNCSCTKPLIIVPCSGSITTGLMNYHDYYFCGNLECNFTIKLSPSCTSSFINLSFDYGYELPLNEPESLDMFRVISNNIILYEMSHLKWDGLWDGVVQYIWLPSKNHNIFQAITTPFFTQPRYLTLSYFAMNISTNLSPVTINETKPYYFHQLCMFNKKLPYSMPLELSPELKKRNATIDIYVFATYYLKYFAFYNGTNLSFQLNFEKCFMEVSESVMRCRTNLQSFTLVTADLSKCNVYLFFKVMEGSHEIGSDGCVFENNVFNFIDSTQRYGTQFSAMSNGKTKCRIFCYAANTIYIQPMWISSNTNNSLKLYAGVEEKYVTTIDTPLLSTWRDLFLTQNIYVIEIPLNSSILIKTNLYNTEAPRQHMFNITSDPYKTVYISPNYGNSAVINDRCSDDFLFLNIQNAKVKFTLLEYDVLKPNFFQFVNNHTRIN